MRYVRGKLSGKKHQCRGGNLGVINLRHLYREGQASQTHVLQEVCNSRPVAQLDTSVI